jgi:hypothetical protein
MLTPQYLLIDQLRIELDKRISHGRWITLAPHYVQNNRRYQTHSGFGLVAAYKYYFGDSQWYLSAGAQFTHHSLDNYVKDVEEKLDDFWLYQTKITQYGLNATGGYCFRMQNHLFGDIYGGIGYRFSTMNSSDGISRSFSNRFFELNHTGLVVVFGVRFGVVL